MVIFSIGGDVATSHVRFKINDLESLVRLSNVSDVRNRTLTAPDSSAAQSGSAILKEGLAAVLDAPRYIRSNFPVVGLATEAMRNPGSALLKFTGVDINRVSDEFFRDVFNIDTGDAFLDGLAGMFAGGVSNYVKCMMRMMMGGFYGNPYGGRGLGAFMGMFNMAMANQFCLGQAVSNAINRDLYQLVDGAYGKGFYGTTNYLTTNMQNQGISTRLTHDVLMRSAQRNDLPGLFDAMSSPTAGNVRTINPAITDVIRSTFAFPVGLAKSATGMLGEAVFSGMDRLDPDWATRPLGDQSRDFSTMVKYVGKNLGMTDDPDPVTMSFVRQTQPGETRKSLFENLF